jgi:RNA polymerase sigma-70 factor, ECF subfamily
MPADRADQILVDRIRRGDADAWRDCIARYEGRLIAFVDSRLRDRAAAEDVVQETFMGFLTALSNYDDSTPLDAFLFAIAAHKLTDLLRRTGRRPALTTPMTPSDGGPQIPASGHAASSLARSHERRASEEVLVVGVLKPLIEDWIRRGQTERLKCAELLFVKGMANKDVARELQISEQEVANHKHFIVSRLRTAAEKARMFTLNLPALDDSAGEQPLGE